MHKQFKVPVKLLLIAAMAIFSLTLLSGSALADEETLPGGDRFEIIDASANFCILFHPRKRTDCGDTDEWCTITVTKRSDSVSPACSD